MSRYGATPLHAILAITILAALVVVSGPAGASVGDRENMSLVGRWARAEVRAVELEGSLLCLAEGGLVRIVDVTDPGTPVVIRDVDVTSPVMDLDRDGSYLYVASAVEGLFVVDVSVPAAASVVAHLTMAGYQVAIDVIEGTDVALLAGRENGMFVMDVSNPLAPAIAGEFDPGNVYGVHGAGTTAYVAAGGDGVYLVDITTPGAPTEIGHCPDTYAMDVIAAGSVAYVATGYDGLTVLDLAVPSAPDTLCTLPLSTNAERIALAGATVYLPDLYGGLVVIDVTDPTTPLHVADIASGGTPRDVAVADGLAHIAAGRGGLEILDVTDPLSPIAYGSLEGRDEIQEIAVQGDRAWLAMGDLGVRVLDLSDPAAPNEIGHYQGTSRCYTVALAGDHAYINDGNWFRVLDTTTPVPTQVGVTFTDNTGYDIAVAGGVAVVGIWHGFQLVDVSDPASPVARGLLPLTVSPTGVALAGQYAYVAAKNDGLLIVDISDLDAPSLVETFDTVGSAERVILKGDLAIVAENSWGPEIVDVSDPAAPALVTSVGMQAYDVALLQDRLYLAASYYGVYAFDIGDPAAPAEAGHYETALHSGRLALYGTRVLANDQYNGLWILSDDTITPIYLVGFTAERQGRTAAIRWQVAAPRAGSAFTIWRCEPGGVRMPAGDGPLAGRLAYEWLDPDAPAGETEYWLLESAADGGAVWFGPALLPAADVPPATFVLAQNHPNPFNPRTTFSFRLAEAGPVRLTVHDARGRCVATLVDGPRPAGAGSVEWDGRDDQGRALASGTYLARLASARGASTRKVTLAR